jgi:hypothetical protein
VRDGLHAPGCRSQWEELADWVTESYPWKSCTNSNVPPLLRLRPEDVGVQTGFHGGDQHHHQQQQQQVSAADMNSHDSLYDNDPLTDMLTRLQEAALNYHDSDTE